MGRIVGVDRDLRPRPFVLQEEAEGGDEVWVLLNLSNERSISIAEQLALLPEDGLDLFEDEVRTAPPPRKRHSSSAHRIYVAK